MDNTAIHISEVNGNVDPSHDLVWGVAAIAREINRSERSVRWLIPKLKSVRKLGKQYVASRTALRRELVGA